jgi:hypothetical protein
VQNIVGAVLDVLSDAAQQALVKAQAPKTGTGVSTRRCVDAHYCGSVAFRSVWVYAAVSIVGAL